MKKKTKARKERRRRKEIGTHSNLNEWRNFRSEYVGCRIKTRALPSRATSPYFLTKLIFYRPSSLTHPPPPPAAVMDAMNPCSSIQKFTYNWIEKSAEVKRTERVWGGERELWVEKWMKSIKSYCLLYFLTHSFFIFAIKTICLLRKYFSSHSSVMRMRRS